MIAAFQRAGDCKSAFQLFNQMQQQSVLPERVTFLNTLSACTSEEFIGEGKRLHSYCSCTEVNVHPAVETALVNMYGKCHSVDDARKTFDMMAVHDVVSWNALIAIYTNHRDIGEALHLFEEMRREGVMPDRITFICIVDACGNQGVLLDNDWIRVNINSSAAGFDTEIGKALMTMHSNCGNIEGAWETFNTSPNRSIDFWNSLVVALGKHGDLDAAFKQTADMFQRGVVPNNFTFIGLLDSCVNQMALVEGMLVHMCIVESHLELETLTCTSIINMYSKCGCLDDAFKAFQTIHERKVVSWNVIISGHADNACDIGVIRLSRQMMQEGVMPNNITFLCMLNAFSSEEAVDQGKRIHCCVFGTEHESNIVFQTALVNMYGKCGSTSSALRVFNDLSERDIVSWSAMISAYVQGADIDRAAVLFIQMLEEGALPDVVTYATMLCASLGPVALSQGKHLHACVVATEFAIEVVIETALICMYCRCGSLDEARRIFGERLDKSVASWNAIMGGLTQSGNGTRAFQLYEQMQQEGMLPDNLTFVSILDACSRVSNLSKGHQIHSTLAGSNLAGNVKVEAALVNMYADCGSFNDAEMVFCSMCSRGIASWTAIISANAQQGNGKDAVRLFKQMIEEGHVPKREIMVSIFSACSHAGLIDDLKELLGFMSSKTTVSVGVDLFNCAIDLFSRAGRLDEAEALIGNMPQDSTIVSWTMLLGACKNHLDVERGEHAALKLLQLDSQNAEPYVALSNLYAAAGMKEEAETVYKRMRGQID
ncbi:hypothetical protein GOP47_0027105 [Adiantum capillus-veneris]|nr:hypothetical protein GOP47_0027105 [Adiantum capillus-veneris]